VQNKTKQKDNDQQATNSTHFLATHAADLLAND